MVVWYSHLIKKCPQFVVIHTFKGFSIVNEAEVDVLLEFSCFFSDPMDVCNLISGSSTSTSSLAFCMMYSACKLSRVTIYSLDVLLSQFGTSLLSHVWF